jgi:hypothetical protein
MNPREEKYEAALQAIAAEIKRQMELENFQREKSPESMLVSRSSSYRLVSEIVADALDIPVRLTA